MRKPDKENIKKIALELLTPIGAPKSDAERLRAASRIRLLINVPTLYLLTFIAVSYFKKYGWAQQALNNGYHLWILLFITYILLNFGVLLTPKDNYRLIRILNYLCIANELSNTQLVIWGEGSLITYCALFIIVAITIYRVFTDYYIALFTALYGGLLYTSVVFLEFNHVIPIAPYLLSPINIVSYNDPLTAVAILTAVWIGIILVFFITNYALNQSLKLHRFITYSVLQRYLPPVLVEKAAKGELSLDTPPDRRIVTIMFADIVGFTALSEKLGPEAVGSLLNRCMALMADIAYSYDATIDKFIGDAIMLVYGAPMLIPPEEQARRSVELALKLQEQIPLIDSSIELKARIGINTGEVVAGNFGTLVRSDYTVIGPAVNVAARLEANSRPGGILISADTARLLDGRFSLEAAGSLNLKGVSEPIPAYFVSI